MSWCCVLCVCVCVCVCVSVCVCVCCQGFFTFNKKGETPLSCKRGLFGELTQVHGASVHMCGWLLGCWATVCWWVMRMLVDAGSAIYNTRLVLHQPGVHCGCC